MTVPLLAPLGLVRQPDSKLVIAGTGFDSSTPLRPRSFGAIARLAPTGRPDASFGTGGLVLPPPATSGANGIYDLVRQPDGRLVTGGGAGVFRSPGDSAADARFALMRFLAR